MDQEEEESIELNIGMDLENAKERVMIDSSQLCQTVSLRNRTDYASLTMDQTEVVDSDIVSASEDSLLLAKSSLTFLAAAHRKRQGGLSRAVTPVQEASMVLQLESSLEDSPIIRRKNTRGSQAVAWEDDRLEAARHVSEIRDLSVTEVAPPSTLSLSVPGPGVTPSLIRVVQRSPPSSLVAALMSEVVRSVVAELVVAALMREVVRSVVAELVVPAAREEEEDSGPIQGPILPCTQDLMGPETQQEGKDDFMLPESQFVAEMRTGDFFYDIVPAMDYFTEEFPWEDVAQATSKKEESGLEGGRGKRTRKPTEKAKKLEKSPVKKRRSAEEEAFPESKKPVAEDRKSNARTSGGLKAEEAVEDKEPLKPEDEGTERAGGSGEVMEVMEAVEELEPVKKAAKGRKSNARKSAVVDDTEDAKDIELGKPVAKGRMSSSRKSGVYDVKDEEIVKPAAKGRKSTVDKSVVIEVLKDAKEVEIEKPEGSKGVVEDMGGAEEIELAANERISPVSKSKVRKVRKVSVEVTKVSVEPDISGKRIRKPTEKAKELEESPAKKSKKLRVPAAGGQEQEGRGGRKESGVRGQGTVRRKCNQCY